MVTNVLRHPVQINQSALFTQKSPILAAMGLSVVPKAVQHEMFTGL